MQKLAPDVGKPVVIYIRYLKIWGVEVESTSPYEFNRFFV